LRGQAELSLTDRRIVAKRLTIDADDLGALHIEGSGAVASLAADDGLELKPDVSLTAGTTASRPLLAIFDPNAPEVGPLHATGRLVRDDAAAPREHPDQAREPPDRGAETVEAPVV